MGPRHSFWSVLGPAEAPKFGPGSRSARGGVNPLVANSANDETQAKVAELVTILGEAHRIGVRLLQMFARVRQNSGLSGIEVLTLIGIANAARPPTVPQMGRSLGHPRQVIQRAVRVLEEEGLVELQPNPGHKRAALLVATEKGRAFGSTIDAQSAEIIADLTDGLDLDLADLAAMSDSLLTLRRRIDGRPAERAD